MNNMIMGISNQKFMPHRIQDKSDTDIGKGESNIPGDNIYKNNNSIQDAKIQELAERLKEHDYLQKFSLGRMDDRISKLEILVSNLISSVSTERQKNTSLSENGSSYDINKIMEKIVGIENKLKNIEAIQNQLVNNVYSLMDPKLKGLQQDTKKLQTELEEVKREMNIKATSGRIVQTPLPVEKPIPVRTEQQESKETIRPVKNNSLFPFLKDYYQLDDKEFKRKYLCKEVDFNNFQDVRNGDANMAEFIEGPGNYYLFTVAAENYLLPVKFFLENQNSRMQVCYFYDIDYDNKGQLQAEQIVSPAIIKKKDIRIWVCAERGKISR